MRTPVTQEVTRQNRTFAGPGHRPRRGAGLRLALLLPALVAWGAPGATPSHAAHPHYERLLQEGRFALERGEPEQAARTLRLACFGLLEEPPVLAGCLVRLALAQSALEDVQGFLETFRRIVDVEERFGGYSAADLQEEARSAFERSVIEQVPEAMLGGAEVFADLVADGAADEEVAGEETGTEPEPRVVQSPARPVDSLPAEDPGGGQGGVELSPEDRGHLDRARELMAEARNRTELDEPFRLARDVAEARPESREAQHLTAVIAYRAARWQDAVRYFRRGGDPGEERPEMLFYMAVALFESGEGEAAAEALRRSLPGLEHTPFVRSYRSKILEGQSTSSRPAPELPGREQGRDQKGVQP